MPSKNKCNNPKRNNHSVQKKNNRTMERSALYSREIDRVGYLEHKHEYMIPVKSARINETKNPAPPCINQSFTSMCRNNNFHRYTTENSYISLEVVK